MRHWWWKVLSVALVLGASIAALRVPLAPALVSVSPDRISPGEVKLTITGYNTSFDHACTAWLENAGGRVCADRIEVLDATRVRATFTVPAGLKENLTDVVVDGLRMGQALFTDGLGNGVGAPQCDKGRTHPKAGFVFPNRTILYETIRNLNFHVPMWFTMIALMGIGFVQSILALRRNSLEHDLAAVSAVQVGLLFCALGLVTGSIWARFAWGAWWTSDVKLNGAAVTTLIYLAYLVLRGSVADPNKRMRLSATYSIFAFTMMLVLVGVLPRLTDSLHPGNGGNPAFGAYDLDDRLRPVFYSAVLGWIGIGTWLFDLQRRMARLQHQLDR